MLFMGLIIFRDLNETYRSLIIRRNRGFYMICQKTLIAYSCNELSYPPFLAEKYVEPK